MRDRALQYIAPQMPSAQRHVHHAHDVALLPTLHFPCCCADLSLIARRAASGAYTSLEHYLADVHLMFRNCRAFNRPDTEYVACANKLEAFLRARVSQGIFALPSAAASSSSAAGAR